MKILINLTITILSVIILIPLMFYAPTIAKISSLFVVVLSIIGGIMLANQENNR